MKQIKTVDLWTEQHSNHYECFNGAFIDGFENRGGDLPYDKFKIVKNCNCLISNNQNFAVGNKHHAVVFYRHGQPVRLMVLDRKTDIEKLLNNALNQKIENILLSEILKESNVTCNKIDLKEKPILNEYNSQQELDIGSCDRLSLLKNMLAGSYTEDDTAFGHYDSENYSFIKNLTVDYKLKTDEELFEISHDGGFLNDLKTRLIILQKCFSGK